MRFLLVYTPETTYGSSICNNHWDIRGFFLSQGPYLPSFFVSNCSPLGVHNSCVQGRQEKVWAWPQTMALDTQNPSDWTKTSSCCLSPGVPNCPCLPSNKPGILFLLHVTPRSSTVSKSGLRSTWAGEFSLAITSRAALAFPLAFLALNTPILPAKYLWHLSAWIGKTLAN